MCQCDLAFVPWVGARCCLVGGGGVAVEGVVRVFSYPLDVGPAGVGVLERHAGAARWAFNFAHAVMLAQWQAFDARQ